eukprot:5218295-Pyramimonas_sp.AAC.1
MKATEVGMTVAEAVVVATINTTKPTSTGRDRVGVVSPTTVLQSESTTQTSRVLGKTPSSLHLAGKSRRGRPSMPKSSAFNRRRQLPT